MGLARKRRGVYRRRAEYHFSSQDRDQLRALFTNKNLTEVGRACDKWLAARGIRQPVSGAFIVTSPDTD